MGLACKFQWLHFCTLKMKMYFTERKGHKTRGGNEEKEMWEEENCLALAEVSYQPMNPYSLQNFSSLGSLGHKPCRR